jgi:hypothetical protein
MFIGQLVREYGSVMNFVLSQRLCWTEPLVPRGKPFEFDSDIRVLLNDWPYGIDKRVVHLVVWTKFELPEDPEIGDLTAETREQVDLYVKKTFWPRIPNDMV